MSVYLIAFGGFVPMARKMTENALNLSRGAWPPYRTPLERGSGIGDVTYMAHEALTP